MRIAILFLWAMAAAAGEASWITRYAAESRAANQACGAKDFAACRQHLTTLLELLDGRADIVYRMAKVEAQLGNREAALRGLILFSKMKLPFADPSADSEFADLRSDSAFPEIAARLAAARQPASSSRPFLTLPEKDLVTEDIAYDPAGERFFISSVRHGKILSIGKDGTAKEFLAEGKSEIWAVQALGVDAKRRYLWASTSAMPESLHFKAEDSGRSALLRFSLTDGALLKRYDLPRDGEHVLGDLTIGPEGDVFVSDSKGPVYWVPHDQDRLQVLIPAGTFRSPQTPALSADGRTLFVPDYSRGISAVDLRTRQSHLVAHPPELSLAGIDGLYLTGNTMLAVQNGTSPERILRLRLDAALSRIEAFDVVEANAPDFGDPTHGVVVGNRFYFIVHSGWEHMADNGQVKAGAIFEAPGIREFDIR